LRVVVVLQEGIHLSVETIASWVGSDARLRQVFTQILPVPAPRSDDHDVAVAIFRSEMVSGLLGVLVDGPHVPGGEILLEVDHGDDVALRQGLMEALHQCATFNGPGGPAALVAIEVERLVHEINESLRAENSRLREQLEAARIRIGFIEGQLAAINEAKATGRKRILVAALGLLAATLTGASEAVAGRLLDGPDVAGQLADRCDDVQIVIETHGVDGT
jgi:hypothetical protein